MNLGDRANTTLQSFSRGRQAAAPGLRDDCLDCRKHVSERVLKEKNVGSAGFLQHYANSARRSNRTRRFNSKKDSLPQSSPLNLFQELFP